MTASWGGARFSSVAIAEQCVGMLASVLRSPEAVTVNIGVMRSFVKLGAMLSKHADMKRKLNALEKKYCENFKLVFDAIHQPMTLPQPSKRRRIGSVKE